MPLIRFGFETVLSNMVAYIGDSGNAAQLNQNLRNNVTNVIRGNPFTVPRQVTKYPAVFVYIGSDDDGWSSIGDLSRDVTAIYNIAGIVQYNGTNAQSDQERNYLADNVSALLRNNVTLSSTVQWMKQTRTALSDSPWDAVGGVHVSGFLMECEVFRHIRT